MDDTTEMTSQEIYVQNMLRKKRGYPLWIPSPNLSLPVHNRHTGVMVGDLGIITPEGGFDFLFNILHDRQDPINEARILPRQFHHLHLPENQQFKVDSALTFLGASDGEISRVATQDTSYVMISPILCVK